MKRGGGETKSRGAKRGEGERENARKKKQKPEETVDFLLFCFARKSGEETSAQGER